MTPCLLDQAVRAALAPGAIPSGRDSSHCAGFTLTVRIMEARGSNRHCGLTPGQHQMGWSRWPTVIAHKLREPDISVSKDDQKHSSSMVNVA